MPSRKVTRKKKEKKKQSKKLSRKEVYRANIIMNSFFNEDDNTHTKENNRCMCIDYDIKSNDYNMENNTDYRRCKNNVYRNTDFCKKHQKCKSFLKLFTNGFEDEYNPSKWSHPYVEGSHNCYSYFLDDIQQVLVKKCEKSCKKIYKDACPKKTTQCGNKKPQPGHFEHLMKDGDLDSFKRKYKCKAMEKKILKDNPEIKVVSFNEKCPKNTYKGAMTVHKTRTFHFYRQDKDGKWSHKPGTMKTSNKDASGKDIFVPHFANRDYSHKPNKINYKKFCNYYCIPKNNIVSTNSI
jgi:hypothetical protein